MLSSSRLLLTRFVGIFLTLVLACGTAFGLAPQKRKKKPVSHATALRKAAAAKKQSSSLRKTSASISRKTPHARTVRARRVTRGIWKEPTYADSTIGDNVDGEDLIVRRAAVEALGPLNGTVVVVDPSNGRLLTIVNQKLAFKSGFQPCSTIKVVAALSALSENVVERTTPVMLSRRKSIDLTQALAVSNNAYFARLGERLGFEKVSYYARLFGLGEKAGLDIAEEQAGILPASTPDAGMGMMTSFGSGIYLTPLQLAALMSAIANGGTLYYLQHPKSSEDAAAMVPRVKRQLDIQNYIPEIKPGMMGAVEFGTARRAGYDQNEPIYGKTGTCTDTRSPTHLGWFGSFNDTGKRKLVVVTLLTGGKPISGPVASGVAGRVYKALSAQNYFLQAATYSPATMVSSQSCCSR
ncbi:MAG: penicillin-binding transpeptidase domain-containing protein [Bryobacteraceae bacterium]